MCATVCKPASYNFRLHLPVVHCSIWLRSEGTGTQLQYDPTFCYVYNANKHVAPCIHSTYYICHTSYSSRSTSHIASWYSTCSTDVQQYNVDRVISPRLRVYWSIVLYTWCTRNDPYSILLPGTRVLPVVLQYRVLP